MKCWKILAAIMALALVSSAAHAEPTVKRNGNAFAIEKGVTADILSQIQAEMGEVDEKKLGFALKKIKNEDLEALCKAYPNIDALTIEDSKELDSIAPIADLKGLRGIKLYDVAVKDLSPLAELTEMMTLNLKCPEMGPDLKWMQGMTKLSTVDISAGKSLTSFEGIPALPELSRAIFSNAEPTDLAPLQALSGLTDLNLRYCTIADLTPLAKLAELKELSLYGANVKDFSPLADCPKLQKLTYYATKDADYSTLGALTQIQELNGGLTSLADISWVADLQNLKKFDVFAEHVTDYSPLAKTKVENFQIWNMRKPVDLKQLDGAVSLKKLKLWTVKDTQGVEGLSSLVNLQELIIDEVIMADGSPVDLTFVKNLSNLEKLTLDRSSLSNFSMIAECANLKELIIKEVTKGEGALVDMSFAKALKNLEKLTLRDSNISNFDSVAECAKLRNVEINAKTTGITSLAALKALPNLKYLTVGKDMFPEEEFAGFNEGVKITKR